MREGRFAKTSTCGALDTWGFQTFCVCMSHGHGGFGKTAQWRLFLQMFNPEVRVGGQE